MKQYVVLVAAVLVISAGSVYAGDNCTKVKALAVCDDAAVKERVEWACKRVEQKGKGAIPEINSMRYECCGEPNYVWINDLRPTMIMHPIKATLNNKHLSKDKDTNGKKLFVMELFKE